jgi:Uncharacterized protein conserved in bacteria
MASLDFEKEAQLFREFYADNIRLLTAAEEAFRTLVVSLLRSASVEEPTVLSRIKDREEAIRKFQRKYQAKLEKNKETYEIREYITDLIGLRVICLYEPDVRSIETLIGDNFMVVNTTDKIAAIESSEDSFGYKGLHLDLRLHPRRADLPEFSLFRELQFELQIRTIIQDAWSVLDHKIKYKKSIPAAIKRRVNTLAALFELADHEFLAIRDLSEAEQSSRVTEKGKAVSSALSRVIDVFDFMSLALVSFRNYGFQEHRADEFVRGFELLFRFHYRAVKRGVPRTAKGRGRICQLAGEILLCQDESVYSVASGSLFCMTKNISI